MKLNYISVSLRFGLWRQPRWLTALTLEMSDGLRQNFYDFLLNKILAGGSDTRRIKLTHNTVNSPPLVCMIVFEEFFQPLTK